MIATLLGLGLLPHSTIQTFITDWFTKSMSTEEIEKCHSLYKNILSQFPEEPFAYDALGQLEFLKCNNETALNYFNIGKQKFPDNTFGYMGRAERFIHTRRYTEAETESKTIIKKFPDEPKGYWNYGRSLIGKRKDSEAKDVLLSGERKSALDLAGLYLLKKIYIRQGQFSMAQSILHKIRETMQKVPQDKFTNKQKILFDHIPKCGGSTVTNYIRLNNKNNLELPTSIGTELTNVLNYFLHLTQEERNWYQLISQHNARLLLPYSSPDMLKITILRDPIEQAVSFYFFSRKKKNKDIIRYANLSDFIADYNQPYINHFSSQEDRGKYSGKDLIHRCYSNINQEYDLVGITENLDNFLHKLKKVANYPFPYEGQKENVAHKRKKIADLDHKTLTLAHEKMSLDIQLYNLVKKRLA